MRKIFLIMAFALMSTSSCYANLTLADASQAPAPAAAPTVSQSSVTPPKQSAETARPVARRETRSTSRPRRRPVWASYVSQFRDHCR